ncbi:N-succinyl-L,L-diaminopimelate desuccinylase, partial [hydrothermal vent metagenome]
MSSTLDLTKQLIAQASVTPDDANCQTIIAERLKAIGFNIENLNYGEVLNLWAVKSATKDKTKPLFVFAGHTDVVPTGPEENWRFPPFTPTIDNGKLYGRGTADMKGSVAAMVTACERFYKNHPSIEGSVGFLITSDEEGPATDGTVKVIEHLNAQKIQIDWCLVGEPSSTNQMGDVVKNGRRGSLGAELKVKGKQGHVAYPHLAKNPIHAFADAMSELTNTQWDNGNDHFPPTTFQISNINSGTGATNVIPADIDVVFNFRFSTETTSKKLQQEVEAILNKYDFEYDLKWILSGQPFLTAEGKLLDAASSAIKKVVGIETKLSTAGGTSDGRFIAPTGAQVLELGPLNATIHQVDEHVDVKELEQLSEVYEQILVELFV